MLKKILVLGALVFWLLAASVASAAPMNGFDDQPENVYVPKDRTIEHGFWKTGNMIDISGTVEKDVYVAGNVVTIDGHVKGDVIGFANTVRISGIVDGNVRMAAQTIDINGTVGKSVTVAGQTVTMGPNATVGGEFHAAASLIDLNGIINGNTSVASARTTISKEINGFVWVNGDLAIRDAAKISGDVTYTSANQATIAASAVVGGKVTQQQPKDGMAERPRVNVAGAIWGWLVAFGAAQAVGWILVLCAPKLFVAAQEQVQKKFWWMLGLGFMLLVVVPIASIIVMVTIVGFPLGLITLLLYGILLYLAQIFVAVGLGGKLSTWFKWEHTPLGVQMLTGMVVISLLRVIPVVGGLVSLVVVCVGLAAAVVAMRNVVVKTLR
jgi:hypothetical protein